MKRIFLTLSVLSIGLLAASMVLGRGIDDPAAASRAGQGSVGTHLLVGLGGLVFAAMVHALVLTYFMGTGRWMEETSRAYALADDARRENQTLKYRIVPALVGCVLLLVLAGATGAAADPASPADFTIGAVSSATLHYLAAVAAVGLNLVSYVWEYLALERNAELIDRVMREVRRIREERGLPV
ncbi:MAG: hypothetical protein KY476_10235 [Planctomycetes bacterium]|nr:hypothetical protein [Planctomycetota bacterium]